MDAALIKLFYNNLHAALGITCGSGTLNPASMLVVFGPIYLAPLLDLLDVEPPGVSFFGEPLQLLF